MLILGIESASLTASAALLSDDTVIAEYTTNFKKTHSETLLPMIDAIFQMTGKDASELTAIAVSQGPGSFTGLRIGASLAKGLAFPKDLPIIPEKWQYTVTKDTARGSHGHTHSAKRHSTKIAARATSDHQARRMRLKLRKRFRKNSENPSCISATDSRCLLKRSVHRCHGRRCSRRRIRAASAQAR